MNDRDGFCRDCAYNVYSTTENGVRKLTHVPEGNLNDFDKHTLTKLDADHPPVNVMEYLTQSANIAPVVSLAEFRNKKIKR